MKENCSLKDLCSVGALEHPAHLDSNLRQAASYFLKDLRTLALDETLYSVRDDIPGDQLDHFSRQRGRQLTQCLQLIADLLKSIWSSMPSTPIIPATSAAPARLRSNSTTEDDIQTVPGQGEAGPPALMHLPSQKMLTLMQPRLMSIVLQTASSYKQGRRSKSPCRIATVLIAVLSPILLRKMGWWQHIISREIFSERCVTPITTDEPET